jgi:hypothetical protein
MQLPENERLNLARRIVASIATERKCLQTLSGFPAQIEVAATALRLEMFCWLDSATGI